MSKIVASTALLLVLASCGGGGSGTLVGVTPPAPSEQLVVQQAFEACGPAALTYWRHAEQQPIALLELGSVLPGTIFVWTGNTNDAFFVWQTNLDLDIPIDYEVVSQFQDQLGDPLLPVPMQDYITALHSDLLDLYLLAVAMPAGSRIAHTVSTPEPQAGEPVLTGQMVHTLGVGGAFVSSAGTFASDDGLGCQMALEWDALALTTPAYGSHPVAGELRIDMLNALGEHVQGTMTYNGGPTAELMLSLDAGRPWRFSYDLATDTLSPLP